MSRLLCSHELYGMYHERWEKIRSLPNDAEFVDQLNQLLTEAPDVRHCAWLDDTGEINRRLLRRLALMAEETGTTDLIS